MLITELKRKRKVVLPLVLILTCLSVFLYITLSEDAPTTHGGSTFPNLYSSQNKKPGKLNTPLVPESPNKQQPAGPFRKIIFKDKKFEYSKITYSSTSSKYQFEETNGETNIDPSKDTILVMSVIGNSAPYGKDREFSHFIQTILTLVENQPNYIFSLALLSNNDDEFSRIQGFFEDETNDLGLLSSIFESISIISAPFLDQNTGFSREERHKDSVQRLRRRLIAKSRNFIMLNALESQQYILTIDSDMVRFDEAAKIIPTFVNSDKDIIVPRIERPGLRDYDKNSWRGERTKPNQEQLDKMDNNDWEHWGYVPRDVKANMYHFQTYLDNKDNEYDLHKDEYEYIIPLDSVGGAILFMKSIVVKQGVIFPTSLIVGTTWDRVEGYDGIETEGICYLAKPLGFSCWGMPNVVGHHTGG